jgi:hypothetical protein
MKVVEFERQRGVWVPLSLPPSLRGGIQRFLGNETSIFHCARGEEMEANGGHIGDRTLNQMWSLIDRMRLVSAQCLCASRSCDRTRWRVRSRLTGRVRSRVESYWKRPDAGTVASGSSSVRIRSLTHWSAARLDQRVRSVTGPARPVVLRTWVVCALARSVSSTSTFGQRNCWLALWSHSWLVDHFRTPLN